MVKQFLLASDFDQTLSFNDSGVVLSELIGFHGFHDKVEGLSQMNLVQQGAELSYLILHDPEFRRVRRDDLIETGKRIRLETRRSVICARSRQSCRRLQVFVLRYIRGAAGNYRLGAGRHCAARPYFRYTFPLQRRER